MSSQELTVEQFQKIRDNVQPGFNYLITAVEHMQKQGFPFDDPLLILAKNAHAALQPMIMYLHSKTVQPDSYRKRE